MLKNINLQHVLIQGGGVQIPLPLKITELQGYFAILVWIPWKFTKLQSQHLLYGHISPLEKRYLMVFNWQANDGPLLVVFGSTLPSSAKKKLGKSHFMDRHICLLCSFPKMFFFYNENTLFKIVYLLVLVR